MPVLSLTPEQAAILRDELEGLQQSAVSTARTVDKRQSGIADYLLQRASKLADIRAKLA